MLLAKLMARGMAGLMGRMDAPRLSKMADLPGIRVYRDIPYVPQGDAARQLDIYVQEGVTAPQRVIIDIHGGGLVYGDKALNRFYGMYLASLGYTVVMPAYRLVPQVDCPAQLADIFACYRWLGEHGAEYGCDLSQVFILGDSAGAFLAMYTTLIQNSPRLQALYGIAPAPFAIRGLGLVSGMFQLQSGMISGLRKLFFGRDYKNSVYYQNMNFASLPEIAQLPPCYLVTSREDMIRKAVLEFDGILQRAGVPHLLRNWPKTPGVKLPHVFSVLFPQSEQSAETTKEMLEFLESHI